MKTNKDKEQKNQEQNSGVNFAIALVSICGLGYAIYVLLSL